MGVMNEDRLTLYDGLIKTHITNTTVAKEAGKGLSTNDYTTTEKNKLAGIANGANKTIVDSSLSSTSTNPVQNKVVNTEFGKKLDKNGDSKDLTNTFVSQDSTNVTQWTDVDVLTSAEKHSSIFNKISTMFKNIRYLYKMLGTADISTLGEGADIGTVTGALSKLNSDFDTNREWKFLTSLGGGIKNVGLPSKFTELYISSYDLSDITQRCVISVFVPYKKLSDIRQSFFSGYTWSTDRSGSCCVSISKTEIVDYGLSFNGVEVSEENRRHDVYYR